MARVPFLICITGRPGAGKSTLAAALGHRLGWPVLHRDTFVAGMQRFLPDGSIDHVSVNSAFFDTASRVVTQGCALILDAAFQHLRWSAALTTLAPCTRPIIVRCQLDAVTARGRMQQRLQIDPSRSMQHDAQFLALPPEQTWQSVQLDFPSLDCDMHLPTASHIPHIVALLQRE